MNKAISVSRLNAYVKMLISQDEYLSDVLVKGEISNFKHHQSGHMYFTLKDSSSAMSCVMFRHAAGTLDFRLEDGMEVIVSGYVSVYEKSGRYQLYASSMMSDGEGALYRKFEELKKKLALEGLFDEEHKKEIPYLPEKIGVVTSKTGAVIKDIINVLDRRFPLYNLELYPSHVQGKGAENEIAAGIRYFNRKKEAEVIIIARGGGSIEDLWPFNEEILARTIYESEIPVISAVGHETDFTIADFVADRRAPTPSAAAEIAVPELSQLVKSLGDARERIDNAVRKILSDLKLRLDALSARPVLSRPGEIYNLAEMSVDRLSERMVSAAGRLLERKDSSFRTFSAKLELLSPLATISRGYAVLSDDKGCVITGVGNVGVDDEIKALLKDGVLECSVKGKEEKDAGEIL